MSALICGSMAFDTIMVFQDQFKNHILPEQVHILNNNWISEFWYGFIVLIGLIISIVYYVNHKKKSFRQSLIVLLALTRFSFRMHKTEHADFAPPSALKAIEEIKDEGYRRAPDFLGSALEKIFDYVLPKFID